MSITCQEISDRAAFLLKDQTNVRWTTDEVLKWITDACYEMVNIDPSFIVSRSVVKLASGARQASPVDCNALLQVVRNMGTDGVTPGQYIRPFSKARMDISIPGWSDTIVIPTSTVVKFAMQDTSDKNSYYVYPPQPTGTGQGYVEIVYSKAVVRLTALEQTIDSYLPDSTLPIFVDYVMYRCFQKDDEISVNAQRAANHYQLFRAAVLPPQPQPQPQVAPPNGGP